MAVKLVECMDWPAENQPGELLKAAEELAKARVDLDALWAYHSEDGEPKIAAVAKRPAKLKAALDKLGVSAKSTTCFRVSGSDKAGVMVPVFRALADANINVECFDALAAGGKYSATFWVNDADVDVAKKILKAR